MDWCLPEPGLRRPSLVSPDQLTGRPVSRQINYLFDQLSNTQSVRKTSYPTNVSKRPLIQSTWYPTDRNPTDPESDRPGIRPSPWTVHGLSIHCSMDCPWKSPWTVHGLSMDCPCTVHGQDSPWTVYWTFCSYTNSPVHGQSMNCPWTVRGQ